MESHSQNEDEIEQNNWEKNVFKTKEVAKIAFPAEKWVKASFIKFINRGDDTILPNGIEHIKAACSRLTGLKNDERILAKEIKQGKILTDKGAYMYLLPKMKDSRGNYIPGPDAIVNGVFFEFKTITGQLDRVEGHFRDSRIQCENVFLKIDNPHISKSEVISKIKGILNDKTYKGGTNGYLLLYLLQDEQVYFFYIVDLK